jgi:mannan endo-1,4-beta-mannosidase
MIKRILRVLVALAVVAAGMLVAGNPAQAATGFYVSNGRLYDANGSDFVMRGANHPHAWYASQTPTSLADIKRLGANTVRVVLDFSRSVSDIANVVSMCKQNKLICVLEFHNTTGYGDQQAATLSQAADQWIRVRSAIVGQERYVIVNIGNEPYGNANVGGWTNDTIGAIQKLRANGLTHTLMVDGPNWGQDWSGTMRTNAPRVFAADSLRNTVFSIHMYGVYGTASAITSYLDAFVTARLPIVVGEFGHNHSDGNVDEDTILSATQSRRLGYLGWSWSGNGSPVQYLDMTNGFNANSLTSWGQRIFNGANGIKATSAEASVYGGGPGGTAIVSTPANRCVDVPGSSQVNGTQVTLRDCNGATNQAFTSTSSGELRVYGAKCLETYGNGTAPGTPISIWDCNGAANQRWSVNSNSTITNQASGLCLDAEGRGTANGTRVLLWTCSGATNQQWTRR